MQKFSLANTAQQSFVFNMYYLLYAVTCSRRQFCNTSQVSNRSQVPNTSLASTWWQLMTLCDIIASAIIKLDTSIGTSKAYTITPKLETCEHAYKIVT